MANQKYGPEFDEEAMIAPCVFSRVGLPLTSSSASGRTTTALTRSDSKPRAPKTVAAAGPLFLLFRLRMAACSGSADLSDGSSA